MLLIDLWIFEDSYKRLCESKNSRIWNIKNLKIQKFDLEIKWNSCVFVRTFSERKRSVSTILTNLKRN